MKPSRNQILCPTFYAIIYMIINKAKWTVPDPFVQAVYVGVCSVHLKPIGPSKVDCHACVCSDFTLSDTLMLAYGPTHGLFQTWNPPNTMVCSRARTRQSRQVESEFF